MLTNEELATINEDRELNENLLALKQLGGVVNLAEKLQTNFKIGIQSSEKEIEKRREKFGRNEVKQFLFHMFMSFSFHHHRHRHGWPYFLNHLKTPLLLS